VEAEVSEETICGEREREREKRTRPVTMALDERLGA
jgi:hypothetical protein